MASSTQGHATTYANTSHHYAGHLSYAPAGLVIPVALSTGISTTVAQAGDPVRAKVTKSIQLQGASIPAGSVISGVITTSEAGRHMGHSGHLGVKFNRLITPDGASYPISAHIVGGLEKYHTLGPEGSDTFRGDNGGTKVKAAAVRGLGGLGAGAVLGTAIGGIAGGGRGAGRGAWSGAAIGAGLGVADSLLLRKGRDINLKSGSAIQLQLDSPLSIAASRLAHTYQTY
jgi:hypothetical protein